MKRTIAAAALLLLVLAGCDRAPSSTPAYVPEAPGNPAPEAPEAPDDPDVPEAPDAPDVPDGPGEARPEVPAERPPINIPSYQQRTLPLSKEIRDYIESQWITECGDGTVCVTLDYAAADKSLDPGECTIVEPYPSGTVERGGTVTYVLDRPCA